MNPVVVITYIGLCSIVGIFGRDRSLGFGGAFVCSLILTPLIVAIMLLLTQPKT